MRAVRDWKRKRETQRGGSKESPFLETLKTQLHMLQGPEQADIILALLGEERLHQKCTNVLSKLKYSVILWFESSQDSFAAVGKKVSQWTELVDCQVHGRKKVLRRDSPKAGKEPLRRRWPPTAMHKTIQPLKKVWEDCHRFHDGCDTACKVNDF